MGVGLRGVAAATRGVDDRVGGAGMGMEAELLAADSDVRMMAEA